MCAGPCAPSSKASFRPRARLGFSRTRAVVSILLPQAIRRALPGCGNELIYLIKYSSLAYMVTCIELTGEAKILASLFFKYLEVFFVVGAVYLALVSLASWGLKRVGGLRQHPRIRIRAALDRLLKNCASGRDPALNG